MIYLDMTGVIGETSIEDMIPYIQRNVTRELTEQYPKLKAVEGFTATLANAAAAAGNKIIMIINEWDAPIREAKDRPDFDGLSRTVAELIGGAETKVDAKGFANDLVTFRDGNDVLTLLIHLGYLAYDEEAQKVRIPNEEVRLEFARAIRQVKRDETRW